MADPRRASEAPASERILVPPHSTSPERRSSSTQAVRPRIGHGPGRAKGPVSTKIDRGVMLRALLVSCAVAAFVLGGFFLLHILGLGRSEEAAELPAPETTARASLVPTIAAAPASPAPVAPPAMPAAEPAPAAPAPTPADFSRPAFLEPRAADNADADAMDDPVPEPNASAESAKAEASAQDGQSPAAGRNGRITTAINLRSAPQRGASVLATLEAGTKVTVFSCKSWCEVAAGDKRGYVYRRAVDQ